MNKSLKDWIKNYLKSRDVFKNEIIDFVDGDWSDIVVKKIAGELFVIVAEELNEDLKSKLREENIVVVCFNTKKNVDFLINNWSFFAKFKNLAIFFVNPNSKTETKWILYPYTHNFIADEKTLASGIRSMAENVEWV